MKVSTVLDVANTKTRDFEVERILTVIRTGGKQNRIGKQVEKIRFEFNKEWLVNGEAAAKEAIAPLKKRLPGVLWSGRFSTRADNALIEHTGLLCADLDGLNGERDSVREKLLTSPYVWAMFVSPSGEGLKVVFRIPADPEKHKGSFLAIQELVREITGREIDQSCKNVSRLCFLSHDPNLYFNPAAPVIIPRRIAETPERVSTPIETLCERQKIAVQLLGAIEWGDVAHGFVTCPGKHLHTTGDAKRDCEIYLNGAPTVHCLHNSCRGIVDGVNRELRSRIGKAEFKPAQPSVATNGNLSPVPVQNVDAYIENDSGNAEMFVDRYDEIVRYIHPLESWFIWDGNRWLPDQDEGVKQLAKKLADELIADSVKTPGARDERKLRRGTAIGKKNAIEAMLWMARSDPRVVIKREQIDVHNFLLGTQNGVIDLRTGEKRDGQKGDFITKACGCAYDAAATAPRWADFLSEIFEGQADLIDYIQRAVGYTLTGDTREQCLFFLHGSGANGKSTFIETLTALLCDYATTASQNVLCLNRYGREPLDEIASLGGARFVTIAETGESRMAEVRIKQLTGGDTVTGKAHYKAANSFQPKFKLWIFGNSKPTIRGVDCAMWRRIRLIPFNVQFPVEKQDSTLKTKLHAELPGILNWAIQGGLAWQADGKLIPPQCVIDATDEYRNDQDILRDFIAETIEKAKGQELAHKELYRAYKAWNTEQGSDNAFSNKRLAQMLRDRSYKDFRAGRDKVLIWRGICLKND